MKENEVKYITKNGNGSQQHTNEEYITLKIENNYLKRENEQLRRQITLLEKLNLRLKEIAEPFLKLDYAIYRLYSCSLYNVMVVRHSVQFD